MAIVKITNLGNGRGALFVEHNIPIPTYGSTIALDDDEYEVEEVRRFDTKCRHDAVRVDVTPIENGSKVMV